MSTLREFKQSMTKKAEEFNEWRFEGLGFSKDSNKYYSIDRRYNEDETKVVINYCKKQLFKTLYGWGLIIGHEHVVWLKDWQVFEVGSWWQGATTCEYQVLLTKDFYKPVKSNKPFEDICVGDCADDSEFEKVNGYHGWQDMVDTAKAQNEFIALDPIKFQI